MGYHSIIYIFLFLPVCLLAYQLAPEKWRGRVLLAFSWIFFYLLSGKLLVYLLGTTLLTHCIGIWLTLLKTEEAKAVEGMDRKQKKVIKAEYQKKGRRVLILGILILLGVLGYLKYFDFFTTNLSYLFGHPVFWTLQKLLFQVKLTVSIWMNPVMQHLQMLFIKQLLKVDCLRKGWTLLSVILHDS